MTLIVNAADLDVTFYESLYLTYNGHYISKHFYPAPHQCHLVSIECALCGQKEVLEGEMTNAEAWTAMFYLLKNFESQCPLEHPDAIDRINNDILPKYQGELATKDTYNRIESDVQKMLGSDVDIEVHGP